MASPAPKRTKLDIEPNGSSSTTEMEELKVLVSALHREVTQLRDENEVKKLQYKYGYYLDKTLYKEVTDLFSDHAETFVEFLGGRYRGKPGVKRLYLERFGGRFVKSRNGPIHGFLLDHPQMQDIVDISPNGDRASGRFRTLMSAGVHKSVADTHPRGFCQWWEGGLYENEYIKEDGVWKIFKLRYFPFWHGDAKDGWSNKDEGFIKFPEKVFPGDPLGPDELLENPMIWPDTRVVPFHYTHPITGEYVKEDDLRAPGFGEDVSTSKAALRIDS